MTSAVPSHHQNQETTLDEPVYLFTDKAVVRPRAEKGSSPPVSAEKKPAVAPPPDQQEGP